MASVYSEAYDLAIGFIQDKLNDFATDNIVANAKEKGKAASQGQRAAYIGVLVIFIILFLLIAIVVTPIFTCTNVSTFDYIGGTANNHRIQQLWPNSVSNSCAFPWMQCNGFTP